MAWGRIVEMTEPSGASPGNADTAVELGAATPGRVPVLQARGISKRFGNVQALSSVDLELFPGELMGLVGDNGAGKSTLIKILSGAMQPDGGEVRIRGELVHIDSPTHARSLGIETVYQDLALIPMQDVAENLFLGREVCVGGWLARIVPIINVRSMRRQARDQLAELGIGLRSVRQRVDTLSGGQRQAVALARAVMFGRGIVILDEPTAALGVRESKALLELVSSLKQRDISIIMISHNLPQLFEITTRIMVMRSGRRSGVLSTAEAETDDVLRLMTGIDVHEGAR